MLILFCHLACLSFLGFNAVFLLIGGLTALIARLVYPAGAAMIWVGGSFLLIRFLARLVAYPGSVNSVRRSIEYGFGKSISTKTKEVCYLLSTVNCVCMGSGWMSVCITRCIAHLSVHWPGLQYHQFCSEFFADASRCAERR